MQGVRKLQIRLGLARRRELRQCDALWAQARSKAQRAPGRGKSQRGEEQQGATPASTA